MGWQSGISGLKMSCLHENQENKFSFKGFDLNSLLRHTKNDRIYDIQGESKKSGISKSMNIALRAIKIKQIKF